MEREVVSIGKSLSELERLEDLWRSLSRYYSLNLRSTAEYAIELDKRQTEQFQSHIQALESQAVCAVSSEEYEAIQASFRGELRAYRDAAAEYMSRMRADLAAAAEVMQSFAQNISTSSGELECQMKEEIARLNRAATYDDLTRIRSAIQEATEGIAKSCEQLQKSNRLTIAQLQDELRTLHAELDQARRSIFVDAGSGAFIRQKIDERVEQLLHQGQPFWILFVWIGLKQLERVHSRFALEEIRKALVKRIRMQFGPDATVGRWSDDVFATIVETEPLGCQAVCKELQSILGAPYSVQENGTALVIPVQLTTNAVERFGEKEEAEFYIELGHVTGALAEGVLAGI